MKLKEQMNKQRAYAIKRMKEAKDSDNDYYYGYWRGIVDSMDWVQEGRNEWTYVDDSDMPQDKCFSF